MNLELSDKIEEGRNILNTRKNLVPSGMAKKETKSIFRERREEAKNILQVRREKIGTFVHSEIITNHKYIVSGSIGVTRIKHDWSVGYW